MKCLGGASFAHDMKESDTFGAPGMHFKAPLDMDTLSEVQGDAAEREGEPGDLEGGEKVGEEAADEDEAGFSLSDSNSRDFVVAFGLSDSFTCNCVL